MKKHKILIIEDENSIRKFISTALKAEDYSVLEASTGKEGISLYMSHFPDLLLLDLGLGDFDGIEIIKKLRKEHETPIIVISARQQDVDKVEALDLGADDYITKPFSMIELLARVKVALRKSNKSAQTQDDKESVFEYDGLIVDFERRKITVNGNDVHLTPIEYNLLGLLIKHQGKVLTHNFIVKEVWGHTVATESTSLRVFMATLRRKIEDQPANPKYIITEVGVGYKLNDQ